LAWIPPLWMRLFHGKGPNQPGLLTPSSPLP
jgi:hypothetical protein